MLEYQSEFIRECLARGFLNQATDLASLDKLMAEKSIVAYLGFDATATSLHVGNLVQVMLLRLLQRTGHQPIVLIGGGTTQAGDPSGKDEMRKMLSLEEIENNTQGIQRTFEKYLHFGQGKTDAKLVNNINWLPKLNYLDFLRQYGKHFSVNRMLTYDVIKNRLDREQPLSFLEFNYMVLQSYDFLALHREYDCVLQFGGSDQWANIISGVDLIRRVERKESFGLTTPLITTASGAKMGKTAQGAVWLNEDKLSSFEFWQFWRNTEDADVGRFLRLFTDLPLDEIARLEKPGELSINEAKCLLADEATRLCHGIDAVTQAKQTATQLFSPNQKTDLAALRQNLPTIELTRTALGAGMPILELLKTSGLCSSNGEAKRLIQGKGAKLNETLILDPQQQLTLNDFSSKNFIILSAGKKRHALIQLID